MAAAGDYQIRVMTRADLERTLAWAEAEGWNPGLDDARVFHAADPLGFFMGWQGAEPAAAIAVVNYDAGFGFLGLYIARAEFRGQGLGMALWREALRRRPAKLIGLDGVVAQQANYARSGFRLAYPNIRFGGRAPISGASAGAVKLVAAREVPFDLLAAYDRRGFPAPRPGFLSLWLDPAHGAALAAIADGRVCGLGAVRACRKGFKIGPLFADDEGIADALFLALAARAGDAPLFLDVPEPNKAALRLAKRYGFALVFETARMYTGDAPDIDLARIFGVTTFELG